MHRILPSPSGPYRVVFAPQAWKEIGLMPTALFDVLQAAVEGLAAKCGRQNEPREAQPLPLRLTVDTLVVTYERDDAARVITLVDVTRAPASAP
jgi:hypothetical protein